MSEGKTDFVAKNLKEIQQQMKWSWMNYLLKKQVRQFLQLMNQQTKKEFPFELKTRKEHWKYG